MASLEINFTMEDVPIEVKNSADTTIITLDDNKYPAKIKLDQNKALELADAILTAAGLKDTEEWDEREYELLNRIEELEEALQDRDERIDYMRRHETYIPF